MSHLHPVTTELILIRHGETEFNTRGVYQGHGDSALTARGEAQARALAVRVRALDCCPTLYCSDLGRARRTAELIADPRRHSVVLEPGLRERGHGVFEGLSRADIAQRHPDEWAAYISGDPDHAPPGAESQRQLVARVCATIQRLAQRHPGERIVAVTHGGVLVAFVKQVLGIPARAPRRFDVGNASLSVFYRDPERGWMVRSLGDAAHLHAGQFEASPASQ